jgi:hypothetical protein
MHFSDLLSSLRPSTQPRKRWLLEGSQPQSLTILSQLCALRQRPMDCDFFPNKQMA